MPADVTRHFCVSVIRSSVVLEFPPGYRNHDPFLLRANWRSKILIDCAREEPCSHACVVGTDFPSMGVDPFGNSIYNLCNIYKLCFHTCSTHLPHLQLFLQLEGGKNLDLRTLWCHSVKPHLYYVPWEVTGIGSLSQENRFSLPP